MRVALMLLLMSAPTLGLAQAQSDTEAEECQSCTARHKSLQALQEARNAADLDDESDKAEPDETGDD